MNAQAIVYSTKGCIECDMVKQMLTNAGIPFEVRDVLTNAEFRDEVEQYGFLGVPVTVINGKAVKGFVPDELNKLIAETKQN